MCRHSPRGVMESHQPDGCPSGGCAWIVDGRLVVESGGKPVPQFLFRANEAVHRGAVSDAETILSPKNLRTVDTVLIQDPSRVDLIYMVVKLLLAVGDSDAAEIWCRRLVEMDRRPLAWYCLALVYQQVSGRSEQALTCAERAFRGSPDLPLYAENYASCLAACGYVDDAMELMARQVRIGAVPAESLEAFLGGLLYGPATTRSHLLAGYRLLGQEISRDVSPYADHPNDPDPDRRMRVGVLSPDLRRNSAAIPLEMFLDGADRDRVEIYAYGNVEAPDFVSERIRGKVDHYENTLGQSPHRVAALVRAHRIDVLVALGGYVRGHGLRVMAHRPAPVQVDYGWVTTTGIKQIDYRLSDAMIDPPDVLGFYVEKTVYLQGGAIGYVPPQDTALVGPLPARHNGYVTFGSFNRCVKITDATIELWSRILTRMSGSRLIVKSPSDDPATLQRRLLPRFEGLGIAADRVEFFGPQPYLDYLDLFNRVDLALDTFPFNGTTTTLESLWMGVPVLSRTGEGLASRTGLSILSRLGLGIFAVPSPEEYVTKACEFPCQQEALEQIRRALRGRMLNSPLCDPRRWAREIEEAFRHMWQQWCARCIMTQNSRSKNDEKGVG